MAIDPLSVDLSRFDNRDFKRGVSRWTEALWLLLAAPLVESFLPGSVWRCWLLRRFGAEIGMAVVIKPRVRIKFPWRLVVGADSWIGEDSWLDNLDWIRIGSHACISQGVYIGTGNHDWTDVGFRLMTAPVQIADQAWVCAKAIIAPGSTVGEGAVIAQAGVFSGHAEAWTRYAGNPAVSVGTRRLRAKENPR